MSVSSFINLRRMPTGRHRFSLRQMRARAESGGFNEVVAQIDRALKVAEEAQRLELGYSRAQSQRTSARGDATLVDNQIDEQIVAIHKSLEASRIGDDDDPVVKAAREMLTEFFPQGVRAITHRTFEEQLSIMETMMVSLKGDFAAQVALLHLDRPIERLGRLIELFRKELEQEKTVEVTFDQVRAIRDDLHEQVCKVVVAVLFSLNDDHHRGARKQRERLFAPLLDQQERVAEARRRNRVPTDVDPETGEEVLMDAEDPAALVEPEPAPLEA